VDVGDLLDPGLGLGAQLLQQEAPAGRFSDAYRHPTIFERMFESVK